MHLKYNMNNYLMESYKLSVNECKQVVHYARHKGNSRSDVVLVHGGPGSGSQAGQISLFSTVHYRPVLIDQRGAGLSQPTGTLEDNTTQHLIEDMEAIRKQLGIRRWHVFGGSWGSTLGLAYAMQHPKRVISLILYGIFLGRQHELEALYYPGGAVESYYPERFAAFLRLLPPEERHNPIEGYWKLFQSDDARIRRAALESWTRLEKQVSSFWPDSGSVEAALSDPEYVLAHSQIENHYFRHNCFVDGEALLRGAGERLRGIPVSLHAGRYDLVCPISTAWELHKAVPGSRLKVAEMSGHTWTEPEMTRLLTETTREHESYL